jgi:hypothetical protein
LPGRHFNDKEPAFDSSDFSHFHFKKSKNESSATANLPAMQVSAFVDTQGADAARIILLTAPKSYRKISACLSARNLVQELL